MDLTSAMSIAAAGMQAQSARLQVTAENLANAESTGLVPGDDPFRRKTVSFAADRDRASGLELVDVRGYRRGPPARSSCATSPGIRRPMPAGYVKYPNVNPLIELVDMREAQRSYEANLNALQLARTMLGRTLDLLR